MNFGENIRQIRNSKGIKSKFMADQLQISPSSYCDIERGRKKLTLEHALVIAEILDVDIKDFFYEDKPRVMRSVHVGI